MGADAGKYFQYYPNPWAESAHEASIMAPDIVQLAGGLT
jgi:hypothetical protein